MSTKNTQRSSFTGKLGFILAAAGSAVGLGNIWRFPYLAAKHGGFSFILVYILLAVTFGFCLMAAEIAIGRKTGLSALGAYAALNKKFAFVGWLTALVPVIILPYYSVIGGWVMKYFAAFVSGNAAKTAIQTVKDSAGEVVSLGYFDAFISNPAEPILWFALFLGITALVVLFGVEKGIEKVSKIMMPILVVLSLIIAVYSMTRPHAIDGVAYLFNPKNIGNFSIVTVLAAMGQLFYSMSIAMGIMITYGSYMKKDVNIESSVYSIEIFDMGIAFLAALMVIPAVFSSAAAQGIDPQTMLGKGPGLMFVTLPEVFNSMGISGAVIGTVFFLLVIFAALTSSISLMEAVVSIIVDKFKVSRKAACLICFGISIALGVPSSLGNGIWNIDAIKNILLGMDILSFFDFITNSVMMPIIAFITCILVGWVIKPKAIIEEIELSAKFRAKTLFTIVIKYIAPICILGVLCFAVAEGMGWLKV
ncbi:MAG: sodium-dependent transporter [Ruminococcaceae bacterium]|nr:sodium-dependent transporter [Oscillospiraceae bacterium]